MDFNQLVLVRQSVRGYKNQPVSREDIMTCLEAARLAPSACNSQPWKFIVVDQEEKLAEMTKYIYDPAVGVNKFITQVPVIIAVVQEEAKLMKRVEEKVPSNYWADFDNGAAVTQFCLQAAELGLGTCIIGSYQEAGLKELLGVPEERMLRMIIAVGYGESDVVRTKSRKAIEDMVSFNQY